MVGVDEAGRGPLAGPVLAAAVILPPYERLEGVRDSKVVPAEEREILCRKIREAALAVGVAACSARVIDRVNPLAPTSQAMLRAVARISPLPDAVLVDGRRLPGLEVDQWPLVDGDRESISIGAASLVAKVTRDAIMRRLDRLYPGYGFAQHKGYATREHLDCIGRLGVSPVHRCSFEPVKQALQGKLDLAVVTAGEDHGGEQAAVVHEVIHRCGEQHLHVRSLGPAAPLGSRQPYAAARRRAPAVVWNAH